MAELDTTDPGWLQKSIRDSFIAICMQYKPIEYIKVASNIGHRPKVKLPVSDEIAAEMYTRMDAQFQAWTGMTLWEWNNND